jgi:hypothetical protein
MILLRPSLNYLFIYFKKDCRYGKKYSGCWPHNYCRQSPQMLIDPLIITHNQAKKIGFIANGFFRINCWQNFNFNVIPIYRKTSARRKPDNRSAFSKCHEYLSRGNTILTFPEGSSLYELNLGKPKQVPQNCIEL